MTTKRVSTGSIEFDLIDQFFDSVELNPGNVTQGFHEVYRYEAAGLKAKQLRGLLYARGSWDAFPNNDLMLIGPTEIFFPQSGTPAEVVTHYLITDGLIRFGYTSPVNLSPDTPYQTAFFQGFVFKV